MKYILTFVTIIVMTIYAHAQKNIKSLENLIDRSIDEIDLIVSKDNFSIISSNFIRSDTDTSLYGVEAIWDDIRASRLIYRRMMEYIPVMNDDRSLEFGKVKVIRNSIKYFTRETLKADSILHSLNQSKYKKTKSTPIGNGFEVEYEADKYILTFRKSYFESNGLTVYQYILEKKDPQLVDGNLYIE